MPEISRDVVFWSGLFLAIAIIAVPAAIYAARACWRHLREQHATPAFTLQDLRDMRARGQISEQEFDAMRAAVLEQFAAAKSAEPSRGAQADDSDDSRGAAPPAE
jgi:hypothetical protein